MLYSCNLFQPQIKHVAFTLSSHCSMWIIHTAVRTCLRVLREPLPIPHFCDGVGKLGVDVVCLQGKTNVSLLDQAGVKGCCEVFSRPSTSVWTWFMTGRWQKLPPLAGELCRKGGHRAMWQRMVSVVQDQVASAASLPKVVVMVFIR